MSDVFEKAWNDFIESIAIEFRVYDFLDWLTKKLNSKRKIKLIPITEKLLLDMGFEKGKEKYQFFKDHLEHRFDGEVMVYEYEYGGVNKEVKFLHQLQILHFALTEKQLDIDGKR